MPTKKQTEDKIVKKPTKESKSSTSKTTKVIKKKINTEITENIKSSSPDSEQSPILNSKSKKTKVKSDIKYNLKNYLYATGKRKTAIAKVYINLDSKFFNFDDSLINNKKITDYFSYSEIQNIKIPLETIKVDISSLHIVSYVLGGGIAAQAESVRLGIAKSLASLSYENKATLRENNLLTRDSREVERKKPGLKKARKSPRWSKR